MKPTIQIIGKVSGLPRLDTVLKFKEAQNKLEEIGYWVVNPVVLVPADATWEQAMRICLKSLLEVDEAAVLPDWVSSKGSQVEYQVAHAIGLKITRL